MFAAAIAAAIVCCCFVCISRSKSFIFNKYPDSRMYKSSHF